MTRLEKFHDTTADSALGCVTFGGVVAQSAVRVVSKWAVAAAAAAAAADWE